MDLVSVIIPTYNRFKYLLNAIKSVKEQTYKNIEIIVVNDCSIQKEYYNFDFKKEFGKNIFIYHLPENSKKIYGFPSPGGHQRNFGMKKANGKYIAFLDDDDYFLPTKIEKQINAMKESNCKISCTEGFIGKGEYDISSNYQIYHYQGFHWEWLKNKFKSKNKLELLFNMYKNKINIWNRQFINIHNCTIGGSSIIMEKNLINKAGYFPIMKIADDYAYWKKLSKFSNILFIREPLVYIDKLHGDGQNY